MTSTFSKLLRLFSAILAVALFNSKAITLSALGAAQYDNMPEPVPRSNTVPLEFSVMASKKPANLAVSDVRLWWYDVCFTP